MANLHVIPVRSAEAFSPLRARGAGLLHRNPGRQGEVARIFSAVANLAFAIATVTYFAQGGSIFLGEILGMDAELAAVLMILIASTYTIASGLYRVVYTDVFQDFLIFGAIMYVIYLVLGHCALPPEFAVSVPIGDGSCQQIETTRQA